MLVQRDDNLAVTPALEFVARLGGEVGAYGFVVVELAVDDCVDGVFVVVEGLGAVGGEVVDC